MYMKRLKEYFRGNNITLTKLEKQILAHEGFRPKYYFVDGVEHFGIGHNVEANPLTEKQDLTIRFSSFKAKANLALDLLSSDIKEAANGVYRVFGQQVKEFSKLQYNALVEMVFQLGIGSFMKFEKTINLIKLGMWGKAQLEALNSKWGRQTPKRAKKVVKDFLCL